MYYIYNINYSEQNENFCKVYDTKGENVALFL